MSVKPWDLFNPNQPRASKEAREQRMNICNFCQHFITLTNQCSKCGCIMPLKTKLANAMCPLGKWGVTGETTEEEYE